MTLLVAGSLLAGCSAQGDDGAARRTTSPSSSGSPGERATPSAGSTAASVLTPDASLVPKTSKDGRVLADSVVLAPGDWGRDFVAQRPAESTPGTWAVLDDGCRWQREKLPRGVLADVSRYSRLPAGAGKGAVTVTAAATVHGSALSADEQLSTTLEEVLRCPEQQPRDDARITGLMSLGTPFGAREQEYADDSVLEAGQYVEQGGDAQLYRWMVARLGTVVVAVSVTGGKGHTRQDLEQLGGSALAKMLTRVEQRLEGK
ncbi:hypothetical protein GR925_13670 [Streptomyces sp. HUCO-GS316]|uniref:hypothetical protein n=1 Tax=Streptomyces sp. HUCO-GS316 TaxID=2692198 RepID=UPI001371556E|nr:hypothetical protein [Streptomyces sp. HUCO-GS316]MXM64467.1 hypothetical protein [Streptomyces sp. HUCO-GS316]